MATQAELRKVIPEGTTILYDRYVVARHISVGRGMSNVYLVEDKQTSKLVVFKQIYDYKISEGKVSDKVLRTLKVEYYSLIKEAEIMQSLSNPGIPRTMSIETDNNLRCKYIIMDYINGQPASKFVRDSKAIPTEKAVRWIKQVCHIIGYLHGQDHGKMPIIYRDLKPDNIVITSSQVYLLDFGTAEKRMKNGQKPDHALGTAGYAAPEQMSKNNPLDTRSDIYTVGTTLYNLVTGISPWIKEREENNRFVPNKPLSILEVNPSLSQGLDEFIQRCTNPDPEKRYQTIEEATLALNNYPKLDKGHRKKQRTRLRITTSTLVLSMVCAIGSGVSFGMHSSQETQKYNNDLSVANQSGRVDDYVNAISHDPLKLRPYQGLIEAIKQDGKFDSEEENKLLGLISPNLSDIKEEDEYGDLAYDIGQLYWVYYESPSGDETQGRVLSTKWFGDAIDLNAGDTELADIYFNIGMFDKNISSAIRESNDSGQYKEYWNNLNQVQGGENGEVAELQIYVTIAECINNYSNRLKSDGIPREDVEEEASKIQSYVDSNKPSTDSPDGLYDKLKSLSPKLQDKIDLAYEDKVQEE